MTESLTNKPPIWFWIVSVIALVWNGMGVNAYLQQAYNTDGYQAMYTEAQRAIDAGAPSFITAAFAIAVFAGVLAALCLLLRKKISVKLWILSLIAVIVQMGYALINGYQSDMIMTIMIIVFAFIFVWFSRHAQSRSWIS